MRWSIGQRLAAGFACGSVALVCVWFLRVDPSASASSGAALPAVPLSVQTFNPVVAINASGAVAAAWYEGPGPLVYAGAAPQAAPDPVWNGNAIEVVTGTVSRGLGSVSVIARSGDDEQNDLRIATADDGVTYVVWSAVGPGEAVETRDWRVAVVRRGARTVIRPLALPAGSIVHSLRETNTGAVQVMARTQGARSCAVLTESGRVADRRSAAREARYETLCRADLRPHQHGPGVRVTTPAGYRLGVGHPRRALNAAGDQISAWDDYSDTDHLDHGLFIGLVAADR